MSYFPCLHSISSDDLNLLHYAPSPSKGRPSHPGLAFTDMYTTLFVEGKKETFFLLSVCRRAVTSVFAPWNLITASFSRIGCSKGCLKINKPTLSESDKRGAFGEARRNSQAMQIPLLVLSWRFFQKR